MTGMTVQEWEGDDSCRGVAARVVRALDWLHFESRDRTS